MCAAAWLRAAAGPDLAEWRAMCARIAAAKGEVTIAMVGKYVELHDAYLSVVEALHHGGYACGRQVKIRWVDAEALGTANVDAALAGVQGVLVPGGFGARGIEGMVLAAQYARVHGVPYLGICLGMQVAVMEAARSLAGIEGAGSREFTPENPHCVIDLMPDQQGNLPKGGTMRLGAPLPPCARQTCWRAYAARKKFWSGTATAMRCATNTAPRWRRRACCLSGLRRTAALWRPWSTPRTPFVGAIPPGIQKPPQPRAPLFRAFLWPRPPRRAADGQAAASRRALPCGFCPHFVDMRPLCAVP
ncbi:MAG: glutamine amidotransferase-related protein [Ruthenibacterium sp.]